MLSQSQTGTVVGLLVVFALVMGIFTWGSRMASGSDGAFLDGQVPGPGQLAGQQLYNTYCFGCHGLTGEGNPEAGIPPLNPSGLAWTKTRLELETHILDGGETMPELSGLVSPDDAERLIDYIQIWWTAEQIDTFNQNNPQD